jgi:cell division protein FtsW (lipid II flippase)
MWDYMKRHEAFVRRVLVEADAGTNWGELRDFHQVQIARMQHERLIHLIVTMFCATFLLLAIGYTSARPTIAGALLAGLLLILVAAYLVHYFRLENGVQRWYHLANRLSERAGRLGASYEGAAIRPWGLPQR